MRGFGALVTSLSQIETSDRYQEEAVYGTTETSENEAPRIEEGVEANGNADPKDVRALQEEAMVSFLPQSGQTNGPVLCHSRVLLVQSLYSG